MSRKQNNKLENHRLKLSTIVERLPLYRFLDQSRAALLKLQPAWQIWQQQQPTAISYDAAYLTGYDAGTLTISVNNASTAALIKHQKSSLISTLNSVIKVTAIKLRIDLDYTKAASEFQQHITANEKNNGIYNTPNKAAIDSIESLQASIKNPDLADTIGKLAQTLKKLSKTPN